MARILIIDDEPLARDTVRMILEEEGHEIVEAANGNEGIETDNAQPADLILTDLIMPAKDGIETILYFREARPDVKIIAISGGGRLRAEEPLELAKKLGVPHVILKPFGPGELIQAVRKCLA